MKNFFTVIVLTLLICFVKINNINGQAVSGYTFTSAIETYLPIAGTNSSAIGDEGIENGIPIGFNFIFGGKNYTHFCVSPNGLIKLGIATTTLGINNYSNNLSNATTFRPLIAAFWDDNNRNTGSISYQTTGGAGARTLTVDWHNVNIGGAGATNSSFFASFQIKLYEGTNVIKIFYDNTFGNAGLLSASIGLNDSTSYLSVTPGAPPTTSSTVPNNSFSNIAEIQGKAYTFTPPPVVCTPATSLTVGSVTGSTASLTCNVVSGATGYQFAVTTLGSPPASGVASVISNYNATGLQPTTNYFAHVRVACSGGTFSSWYTTPFTTGCTILSIPYAENFDTVIAPVFPTCVIKQDLNAGSSWATTATSITNTAYSVPNCMMYTSNPSIAANDWFFTPPLTFNSNVSYRISFYVKNRSQTFPEKLEVKYGNANNSSAMTNMIFKDTNITNTAYRFVEQDFSSTFGGTYYVGFHNFSNANQETLSIDDIRIDVTPTCGFPTLINVNLVSSTIASVNWHAPTSGTVTGYQYAVTTSSAVPTSSRNITGTTLTLTDLIPGTHYYFQIRSDCGSGNYSSWTVYPFFTPCGARPVPYFENFDTDITVPGLPYCYTSQDLNGASHWNSSKQNPYSAPNCMVYNYDTLVAANDWFFTPAIHLNAGSSYKISYLNKARSATFPEKLEVKYGLANNAAAMTNLLYADTNIFSTVYLTSFKNFTPVASGDYYFGFHAFSNADRYDLNVDDIRIDYSTDCGAPKNLGVNLNADFSGGVLWNPSTTGTVSTYQYAITTSATPPASGTIISTPFANFSPITPGITYYLHVKSYCVSGLYSAWSTLSFGAPCVAYNIPYTENFDLVTAPSLALCMSGVDVNGGTTWKSDSIESRSSPNCMVYNHDINLPGDDWLFTPGLNLTAGTAYRLTFYYKAALPSYAEQLEVKYGTAYSPLGMTNLIFSNQNIINDTYQLASVDFTPTTSGPIYIGFHVISLANKFFLNIDDIKVDLVPNCGLPTNLAANFTTATAGTASWTAPINSTPTGYQYAITQSNIPPASGTAVATTSTPISGLQIGVRYFLHVRTVCAGGLTGNWATYTFTTPCQPLTIPYSENFDSVVTPYLGNCMTLQDRNGGSTWISDTTDAKSAPNSMIYNYYPTIPGDDWALTPGLMLTGGTKYRLSFYYKAKDAVFPERLEVKYGRGYLADSMTTLLFLDSNIIQTSYQLAQIDFIPATSGAYEIGFHVFSLADKYNLNIDDIKVDVAVDCGLPANPAISFITDTSGTASWVAPTTGSPTGYQYAITTSKTPPASGTAVVNNSGPFAGLTRGLHYFIHVRTVCTGLYSNWVTDSFYTPCTARNIPYTENFDGVTAPAIPVCITKQDFNAGTTWNTSTFNAKSAPNCMTYNYSTTIPADDWFYTAPINLVAGTKYRLSFYYRARNATYPEKLEVKYGSANTAAGMTNLLFSDTNIVSTTYLLSEPEFTATATGVYYIGFHAFSLKDKYDLNVDDIKLDVAPLCSKPKNLNATVLSGGNGTVSWAAADTGVVTGYQYAISTSAGAPLTGTATTNTTAGFSNLTQGANYYLHVRTSCSGGVFSQWASLLFNIPCSFLTIPYSENFDATTAPNLPPCMSKEDLNGGTTWNISITAPNSAPNCMVYNYDTGRVANDWFYTPALSLNAGTSYRLSFYYKARNIIFQEKLEVKYGNANNAAAMTNLVMSDTNINFITYQQSVKDFIPATTGLYYFGFHAFSLKNKFDLNIDNLKIDFSPNCSNPTNPSIQLVGGNAGTVTWSPTTPGIPTGYEYLINNTAADPVGPGIAISDSFVSFSGLTMYTAYYFHVRTICTNGNSIWVTKVFYTLPNDEPCTALALSLDGPQLCGNTQYATSIKDPNLPNTCSTPNNTVWYKYTPAVTAKVFVKTVIPNTTNPLVGYVGWYTAISSCPDSISFTGLPVGSCKQFGQTGVGDIDTLLSPMLIAGTTYYLMVDGSGNDNGEFCISLITPPAPPSCTNNIIPANGATNVLLPAGQVALQWNKATGATAYNLILDTINPPLQNRGTIADTSYLLNGLNYKTTYYWYVVPVDSFLNSNLCTGNITSFTTENPANCIPLTSIGCQFGDSISYFSLKGEAANDIMNYSSNSCNTAPSLGYTNYSGIVSAAVLSRGYAYSGFIQTGDYNDYVSIWIDYNNNGYFENSERLLNNLNVGLTKVLYSIFIPSSAPTGLHKLRVRNVYYLGGPASPTDPCNRYIYSETEDYSVNIISSAPVVRSVVSGTVNNCDILSSTTVDSASNNINAAYIALLDSNNNYVAYIYPDGNTLGTVIAGLYIHSGAIRHNNGAYYLNRNITVIPQKQPVSPYRFRMFYKTSELDSLIAQPGSGVNFNFDLVLTKAKRDSCTDKVINTVAGDTNLIPTGFGNYNGDKFVDFTGLNSFSTFYLNGHHVYRFTGNGNWSLASNWENNIIPPPVLPEGDTIYIDNIPGGQCTLDIIQSVSSAGSVIVVSGKNLIIPGLLKLQ